VSSVSLSAPVLRSSRARAFGERLADEGLLVAVGSFFTLFVAAAAPYAVLADSWLSFLGGREIVQHGLPRHDELAVLSHGRDWIDQQWLAQLAFYGLEHGVGLAAAIALVVPLVAAPAVAVLALARRRGASPRSVALFAIVCLPTFMCALRAQAFSPMFFVALLALLAAESRRPTRRVWLALPLVALWANVHGAALVGASLVCLLGVVELMQRKPRLRAVALLLLPGAMLLVSPYGLSLVGYYRSTIGNPVFAEFLTEWAPPVFPSITGVLLFTVAAAALVLVARRPRALTLFELGALALTLGGALLAVRSIVWFAYAALLLLPALLEQEWPQRDRVPRRLLGGIGVAAVALGVATTAVAASASRGELRKAWPQPAVDAVRSALASDPRARVLANAEYADWLLYELPELRGRIAFDGRWEVLAPGQIRTVRSYLFQTSADWERVSRGYDVLVLSPKRNPRLVATYDRRGTRVLYRAPRIVVFERKEEHQ
jgi:hypothetical protein